jgi:hypothetical protein
VEVLAKLAPKKNPKQPKDAFQVSSHPRAFAFECPNYYQRKHIHVMDSILAALAHSVQLFITV